jgi:NitT/TauT family transport system permease protein
MKSLVARAGHRLRRFYSMVALLIAWELLALAINNPLFLPRLSAVVVTTWVNLVSGTLPKDIVVSTFRCLSGFFVALLAGVPLGILMGWSRRWDDFWNFLISFTNPIPKLGLLPLFILWLGIGESSKIALIAAASVFPVLINTYNGVKGVSRLLIWRAATSGATDGEVLRHVVFHAALPHIFTGARLAMAVSWIVLLGAEMVAADVGLGFRILYGGQTFDTRLVFSGLLVIALIGFAFDRIILASSAKVCRWYFRPGSEHGGR